MKSLSREKISTALLAGAEVMLLLTLVTVTLLYSPKLADNFLGKMAFQHLLAGIVVLLWGWARLVDERSIWLPKRVLLPFLILLIVAAIAALYSRNGGLAWESWFSWAQWLALLVVVADLARDRCRIRRLVCGIVGLQAVVSAIGLLQVVGIDAMSLPSVYGGAPLSSLGNTNFVAHYLEAVLPMAFAITFYGGLGNSGWTRQLRAFSAIALVLGSVLLVLAGSRGGWLGVAGAVLVMLCAGTRPRDWGRRLALALLAAGLLSPVAGFVLKSIPLAGGGSAGEALEQVAENSWVRAMSTFDKSNFSRAMRLMIWRDSLQLVRSHPWIGVGPAHYGLELPAHRSISGQREWRELMGRRGNQPYHAHNEFLETWAETGVFGLLALVWLLAAGMRAAWRAARDTDVASHVSDHAVALGCLGGIVAASAHALFSFNLRDPVSGTHVWVLCGIVATAGGTEVLARWSTIRRGLLLVGLPLLLVVAGVYHGVNMLYGDVYFLHSQQHLSKGHGNRAIIALRQAVDWRQHEFSYHHWHGRVAQQMKLHDEATLALSRSLELHENNPGAIRLLATSLLAKNEGGLAVEPLRRAIRIDALTPDNYVLLADALRQSGDPSAAIGIRRQAVALSGEPQQLLALALDHYAAGHIDSAIAVLEQAAHTAPGDAAIAGNLGALLIDAGRFVEGEARTRQALSLEPNRAEWYGNLSSALVGQRKFQEALDQARIALKMAPANQKWVSLVRQLEKLVRQLENFNAKNRP